MSSFDHAALERAIEAAWEARDSDHARRPAAPSAPRSRRRSRRSTRARCASRSGSRTGRWQVNQWAKKAVLLGFRLQEMGAAVGRAAGRRLVGQGRFEVRGLDRARLARRGLPRGADGGGAPLGLRRAGRGADAVVRQRRRLRRRGDDGRHLGDGRAPAPRSAGTCISRAASGSAACSSRCRPGRRSSRTTASSAPAREVVEGCIVREGSVLGMGVFIGQSTKIVDRATGEVFYGEVPPYSVVVAGSLPGKPLPDGDAGPEPLLRGHRQAGGRADPVEDGDQRAAARLRRWRRSIRSSSRSGASPATGCRTAATGRDAALLRRRRRRGRGGARDGGGAQGRRHGAARRDRLRHARRARATRSPRTSGR